MEPTEGLEVEAMATAGPRAFDAGGRWAEFRDRYGTMEGFVRDGYLYAPPPVKTGIAPIDVLAGGIFPGVALIGGEPGAGKSAMALQIAANAAAAGRGVLYVSLEMDYAQCVARVLSCASASVDGLVPFAWSSIHATARAARARFERGRREGRADEVARELQSGGDAVITAARWAKDNMPGLAICADGTASTLEGFTGVACEAVRNGAGLVVLDYLQLLTADGQSDYERVGAASRALTALATQTGVPFVVLSSLSREGVKSLDMHAFRGSGQIEYDADLALLLTRGGGGGVELRAVKSRHGGAGQDPYPLTFEGEHSRFTW